MKVSKKLSEKCRRQTDKQTERRKINLIDRQTEEKWLFYTEIKTDRRKKNLRDVQTNEQKKKESLRQTYKQTNRRKIIYETDKQTNNQIEERWIFKTDIQTNR